MFNLLVFIFLFIPSMLLAENACIQESCTKNSDKSTCGVCCNQKYRFTNQSSDIGILPAIELKEIHSSWDSCINFCEVCYPAKKENNSMKKDKK